MSESYDFNKHPPEHLPHSRDLTLYQIEDGLAYMIEYRAERMADKAEPPTEEELAAIDGEIDKYQFQEPVKVSGVAAMFRKWRAQRTNIKAEIERLKSLDNMLDSMETRLKDRVAAALELLPMPAKGCRKLSGVEGSVLMLKGNGGVEPLQVDGWDSEKQKWTGETVLPYEFQTIKVRMPRTLWANVVSNYNDGSMVFGEIEPNGAAIRKALTTDCATCNGDGKSGLSGEGEDPRCQTCGGSGKQGVPGARLLERGQHVEVR